MARILVVDDHASNRELIVTLVKYQGHEPYEAGDGMEALGEVRRVHPDLVICDILMPTMDGYEFVRQLRADTDIAQTDVIFYTATFLENEARNLARACGVTQILLKPSEPEDVLRAIELSLSSAAPAHLQPTDADENFDRDHRRLLADTLVEKANQLDRANRRLAALTELNLQLASERDPDCLLDKVCRGGRELIGARYAILGIVEEHGGELTRITTSGMADADAHRMRQLPMDIGASQHVLFGRSARRFLNPSGDPRDLGLTFDYVPMHSGLIVPIASLAHAYGWILLIDKLGADCFSDEDEQLLSVLAAQAGRIYESGSLFAQIKCTETRVRALNMELEQRVSELQHVSRALRTLSAGNRTMLRARSESELLASMCEAIVSAGDYDTAMVWYRLGDNGNSLHAVAESGQGPGLASQWSSRASCTDVENWRGVVSQAVHTGMTQKVSDVRAGPGYTEWRAHLDEQASAIACPLRIGDDVFGALAIYHSGLDTFQADEMHLLTESADDLAFGIATLRAQAEQARTQAALHRVTYFDLVTGLPNEAKFNEMLQAAITLGEQSGLCFALLQTTIDRWRDVTEALGVEQGDEMLREFSKRLLKIAPPDALVARLRGDEFVILLPGADGASAREVATRIEGELARPFTGTGIPLDLAAKSGIALFPNHGSDANDLLRRLGMAARRAQEHELSHVVFDRSFDRGQSARLHMANALRRAIDNGDLRLYLQPKVEMASGRLCGAEALVRWQHVERGLIPPSEFIPLAEQIGLIKPLTEWMLSAVLQLNRDWLEQGCALPIAVNLSARNLRDEHLLQHILQLHEGSGVPRGMLELEITESTLMDDAEFSLRILHQLQAEGIPLHIDDFGTGYSSLSYLQKLPVNSIKIDQSFVRHMIDSRDSAVIVKSTIDLIHDLGRSLIAEGVETQECWNQLLAYGCDVAQGYFIARPMPAEDFQQWVAGFRPPQVST